MLLDQWSCQNKRDTSKRGRDGGRLLGYDELVLLEQPGLVVPLAFELARAQDGISGISLRVQSVRWTKKKS